MLVRAAGVPSVSGDLPGTGDQRLGLLEQVGHRTTGDIVLRMRVGVVTLNVLQVLFDEIETAPGSEVFEEIARIEGSTLKLSTADGSPVGGALTVDDLDGRGLRVLSGDELVLTGDL